MKLKEIYETAVKMGIKADPRGESIVEKELQKNREKYEKLVKAGADHSDKLACKELEFFDEATLLNPYADSRLLCGDENCDVKTVLMGIDMEVGELLLADRLREKGTPIDLVISHHPEGSALAALDGVMHIHSDLMTKAGVLPNIAQGIMVDRIKDINRNIAVNNHQRSVNAAVLLGLPLMSVHTPADNLVTEFLTNYLAKLNLETVDEVLAALEEVPEYRIAAKNNNRPQVVSGSGESKCGKIYVDFTGGTSGACENYKRLTEAGISTVIAMHCTDAHLKVAKENYLNVIVASHIGSDSIGCNLFLDALEQKGIKIIPTSGLIRVSRN